MSADSKPLVLPSRARALLVCLLLKPHDRASWAELEVKDLKRSKRDLRDWLGDEWVDPTYGAYRLRRRPWVDVEQMPPDDREALEFCCERGDLLPESDFGSCVWIEEARQSYHQRLSAIAARLIERDSSPVHMDALLARATRVLSAAEVERLRDRYAPTLPVDVIDDRISYLIKELEWAAAHPETAREPQVIATLYAAMDEIETRAITRRPCSSDLVDRLSAVERLLRPRFRTDVEPLAWRLANSRMYASDTTGAFAELRPWIDGPHATASVLCIAGFLNMSAGWPDAAHQAFSAGLERCGHAPTLALAMREKRDILLAWGRGRPPNLPVRVLREDPYFEEMSIRERASIYCSEAKLSGSAVAALRIFQAARELDAASENPHYELNIARSARRAGRPDLMHAHLNNFNEMLQTQTAIGLRYTQMTVQAELIESEQHAPEARSSPRYRARLQEADALYDAVVAGALSKSGLSPACSGLIGRSRIALATGDPRAAYSWARTVKELAMSRAEQHLRPSHELETKARATLSAAERGSLQLKASEQAAAIVRLLPQPLVPQGI